MKILLIGPAWGGHLTAHVEEALRELGESVDVFYYRPPMPPSAKASRFLKALAGRNGQARRGWTAAWMESETRRLVRWHDRRLEERVAGRRYDLILVLKGDTVSAATLKRIRCGAHLALWLFDDPFVEWMDPPRVLTEIILALDVYDSIFVFDSYYVPLLKKHASAEVRHLPLAYNDRIFRPLAADPAKPHPISFVGSGYHDRIRLFQNMIGSGLRLWGPVCGAFPDLPQAAAVTPDETNRIYNQSKINLNLHARQSVRGANMRVYEVLGAGGFLLTDWKEDIAAHFEKGKDLAVYETPEEAVDRARYYLEHEDERLRIQERVRPAARDHTYRHRLQTLLVSAKR